MLVSKVCRPVMQDETGATSRDAAPVSSFDISAFYMPGLL